MLYSNKLFVIIKADIDVWEIMNKLAHAVDIQLANGVNFTILIQYAF